MAAELVLLFLSGIRESFGAVLKQFDIKLALGLFGGGSGSYRV
jgi:hypothetical protein